jgi:hypothetical protein
MIHRSIDKLLIISFIALLGFSFLFSAFPNGSAISNTNSLENNLENSNLILPPEASYERINRNGEQPVGNISVTAITSMGRGLTVGGLGINILNITFSYVGFEFLGTQKIASVNTRTASTRIGYITIRINDTARFTYYANDSKMLAAFKSTLYEGILQEVYMNSTQIPLGQIQKLSGGYVYNYSYYHNLYPNGILNMHYIIDYNITLNMWRMIQDTVVKAPYLTSYSREITGFYNYTFAPGKTGLDLTATYLVNLPDASRLIFLSMSRYTGTTPPSTGIKITAYTKYSNNSILINTATNITHYSINFKANFTLSFVNRYWSYWNKDYLYSGRDVRARQYELQCTDGPSSIMISHFKFNESSIPFEDKISLLSTFERPLTSSNMNYSSAARISGTTFTFGTSGSTFYFLVKGEIDIITIRYHSERQLNIIIVDQVSVPVMNAEIRLFYGSSDILFGTIMSKSQNYPIAAKYTDNQGQIILKDLPSGSYKISIYFNGVFVQNSTVSSSDSLSYIETSIPHFPTWTVVFSSLCAVFIISGLKIIKKNKRS